MMFVNQLNRVGNKSLMLALILSSFIVQAQNVEPVAAVSPSKAASDVPSNAQEEATIFHFPQWPQRRQAKEEVVPPPPPGPYMSAALNGGAVKAPSFGNSNRSKPRAMSFDSSNVTMDTFSPDIPWPTNLSPPSRWMPDNGYQYVQPPAMQNTQQRALDNQHKPRSGQSMNWQGMPFNGNPMNNHGGRPDMSMPNMRWQENRAGNKTGNNNAPMNWMPSMEHTNYRSQARPYSNNTNNYMPPRNFVNQRPLQGR